MEGGNASVTKDGDGAEKQAEGEKGGGRTLGGGERGCSNCCQQRFPYLLTRPNHSIVDILVVVAAIFGVIFASVLVPVAVAVAVFFAVGVVPEALVEAGRWILMRKVSEHFVMKAPRKAPEVLNTTVHSLLLRSGATAFYGRRRNSCFLRKIAAERSCTV